MRSVNALDFAALSNAVRAAAEQLLSTSPPWKRSVRSDIRVLMNPMTYDVISNFRPGYAQSIAGFEIDLDTTIMPDTIRVRDRRNVRDEVVRLTL